MKKIFFLFSLFSFLFSLDFTFSYTDNDLSNAQYLAKQGIVQPRKHPSLYRLDDLILRQEVIGMVLKIKGVTLPEKYTCKNYFADVTQDEWVCRAIELAADNGIISRENKNARPRDTVTRAEALAMLLKTGKVSLSEARRVVQADGSVWSLYQDLKKLGFTQWQADMLDALPDCSIINHGDACEDGADMNTAIASFQPNSFALRASVFEFAALMLGFQAGDETAVILDDFSVLVNTIIPVNTLDEKNILSKEALQKILQNAPIETNSQSPEVIFVVFSDFECPFCARYFQDVIGPLLSDTTHKIALVYKQFPLSFHEHAYQWALESECVHKNLGDGDFFKYIHARYLSSDTPISTLIPGLSEKQMKECLTDETLSQKIVDDQDLGAQYQVSGTPTTLVINVANRYYQTVVGAYSKETLENTLKAVREYQ